MYTCYFVVLLSNPVSVYAHSDPPTPAVARTAGAAENALSLGHWDLDLRFNLGATTTRAFSLELVGGPVFGRMLSGDPEGWWGGSVLVVWSMTRLPRTYFAVGPAMASPQMDVGAADRREGSGGALAIDTRLGLDLGPGFAELSFVAGSRYGEQTPKNNIVVPRLTLGIKLGE